jgi:predicted component of type VI protein secretion system
VIQLQILSGKQAGSDIVVRRFPFTIGRSADANHKLEDAGVWDRHLQIEFRRHEGFCFVAQSNAMTVVNGEAAQNGILRNGDVIEVGSVQLRFWLARSEQMTLRVREALTWTALFALFAAQIGLIYWLLR